MYQLDFHKGVWEWDTMSQNVTDHETHPSIHSASHPFILSLIHSPSFFPSIHLPSYLTAQLPTQPVIYFFLNPPIFPSTPPFTVHFPIYLRLLLSFPSSLPPATLYLLSSSHVLGILQIKKRRTQEEKWFAWDLASGERARPRAWPGFLSWTPIIMSLSPRPTQSRGGRVRTTIFWLLYSLQRDSCTLSNWTLFKQPHEMNTVIMSVFQMEKLRLLEVK